MTAQIDDVFHHHGTHYALAGISEGELFDPTLLELRPSMATTACWRGYQAVFGVVDSRLVVESLHVNLLREGEGFRLEGPVINGIAPTNPGERSFFNNIYERLNYHLEYTGGHLLAEGFIRELYVHMGFHPCWKYEKVLELVFKGGALNAEHDRSEAVAEFRRAMLEARERAAEPEDVPSRDEIREFVERAFDRTYRL